MRISYQFEDPYWRDLLEMVIICSTLLLLVEDIALHIELREEFK
jgi:hypothetical protein